MTNDTQESIGPRHGGTALIIAAICFGVFFANVAVGAAGADPYLSPVTEMLLLFVSVASFVVGILAREATAEARKGRQDPQS